MNQIQQGDVILRRVNSLPLGCKEVNRKNKYIVLAEGEATGHAHRIADVEVMFLEKDGMFYLKNDKDIVLEHEEHEKIVIEPGIWQVGQVVEKDWLSNMVNKVID